MFLPLTELGQAVSELRDVTFTRLIIKTNLVRKKLLFFISIQVNSVHHTTVSPVKQDIELDHLNTYKTDPKYTTPQSQQCQNLSLLSDPAEAQSSVSSPKSILSMSMSTLDLAII